jgi:hypothetical protein
LLALPIGPRQLDPGNFNLIYGELLERLRALVVAGPHDAFFASDLQAMLCAGLQAPPDPENL